MPPLGRLLFPRTTSQQPAQGNTAPARAVDMPTPDWDLRFLIHTSELASIRSVAFNPGCTLQFPGGFKERILMPEPSPDQLHEDSWGRSGTTRADRLWGFTGGQWSPGQKGSSKAQSRRQVWPGQALPWACPPARPLICSSSAQRKLRRSGCPLPYTSSPPRNWHSQWPNQPSGTGCPWPVHWVVWDVEAEEDRMKGRRLERCGSDRQLRSTVRLLGTGAVR